MASRRSDLIARSAAPSVDSWLCGHAALMCATTIATAATGASEWLAVAAASSFAVLWLRHRGGSGDAPTAERGGPADWLTAGRLSLVLTAAAFIERLPHSAVLALFAINVIADVADGYVARRCHQATSFGAVFDREADGLFVLVVYLWFFLVVGAGAWVLALGLLPYLYRLAVELLALPVPADAKERLAAPLAGINFALLLVALALPAYMQPLLLASALVVLTSFSSSFWKLYRDARSIPQ